MKKTEKATGTTHGDITEGETPQKKGEEKLNRSNMP